MVSIDSRFPVSETSRRLVSSSTIQVHQVFERCKCRVEIPLTPSQCSVTQVGTGAMSLLMITVSPVRPVLWMERSSASALKCNIAFKILQTKGDLAATTTTVCMS